METQDKAENGAQVESAPAPGGATKPDSGSRSRLKTVIIATAVIVVVIVAAVLFMVANRDSVVPDVSLMTEEEAVLALSDAGFEVGEISYVVSESVGSGRVVSQVPAGGATASVKTPVALTVAEPSAEAPVPDVVLQPEDEAARRLTAASFVPVTYEQYSETVPTGIVVSQLPGAGAYWMTGKQVIISVSRGSAGAGSVEVPALAGKDSQAAKQLLDDAGLEGYWLYDTVSTKPQGLVLAQAPESGIAVAPGAKVAVWVAGQPEF